MSKVAVGALIVGCLAGTLLAGPAFAADHVRVVLDLSGSMRTNDPGQLALLATTLLHDLARPNTTRGDSFVVIPFDQNWVWRDADDPPPRSDREEIRAAFGERTRFAGEVLALPYTAQRTHYYPGLKRAIDELAQIPGGGYDVRIVVLVTDGFPEGFPDRERDLIRHDLLPKVEDHRLRLYVLAFGPQAHSRPDFFEPLVRAESGTSLGDVFVDPDGSRLLENMVEIFGRSFGYTSAVAGKLPLSGLDLAAGGSPEQVAVVISTPRPQAPSRLELQPPPGGGRNLAGGLESAQTSGGSYGLQWVLGPDRGSYALDSDVLSGTVAVLRPMRLELEIRPFPPAKQANRVMAGKPFPIGLMVKPAGGAGGDPGTVAVKFREHGERSLEPPPDGKPPYVWTQDWRPPVAGAGTVTPEGRFFELRVEFPQNDDKPGELYAGHLEVEVSRREAMVGALSGLTAHRVEVHPLLALTPRPLDFTTPTALGRRDKKCASFTLDKVGELPHPDKPRYAARAAIELADLKTFDNELHQASFTLDGLLLEVEGKPGPNPGEWYKGRELSAAELLGEHELCLTTGKPKAGDPANPLPLVLRLTLLESPYDDLRVIEPFTFKALIAPPTVLERWGSLLLALLALLLLLLLLWHLRNYPQIPADLGYAVAREGGTLAPRPFPPASPLARALALVAERPLSVTGEDAALGWVRPADAELYQLRLPKGIEIEPTQPGETLPLDRRRRATIAVHRTYKLRGPRGRYVLRLEYR